MSSLKEKIESLNEMKNAAPLRFYTLGQFCLWRDNEKIASKTWGRDKTLQLIQYLISNRQRQPWASCLRRRA